MGVPAYNPELANQARNYGKVLRSYHSPFNATLYMDEAKKMVMSTHLGMNHHIHTPQECLY